MRLRIAFLLFALPNSVLLASPAQPLQEQASERQLWLQPEWLQLLRYDPQAAGYKSQVDDADFFISAGGASDPKAELLANLAAFYDPAPLGDSHPQCRFGARLDWLAEQLSWDRSDLPPQECALYRQWRDMVPSGRVTMVFPAYHLNSPSSMFGHTLLRLDPAEREGWSEWLGFSVSFGADVRADDNSLFYAFKGLSGGYPGHFIVTPYFEKIREYNKIENRDVWEYELNLSPAETERMVRHLWELKEIDFDYYFFDENCSYRVLELLEIARPGLELTERFVLTAIPVDTIRAVVDAGLVTTSHYRPSRGSVLEHQLSKIPKLLRPRVRQLAADPASHSEAWFQALNPGQRYAVVNAAYEYLRYLNAKKRRSGDVAKRSYKLIKLVNQYAPEAAEDEKIPQPQTAPNDSHRSKRIAVGAGRRAGVDTANLGFRMSFHDLEGPDAGFLRGAQINIASADFIWPQRSAPRLERLDLVDIFSLTPRNAFFKPWSWAVRAGLERQAIGNTQRKVGQVSGGGGFALAPFAGNLSYALLSGRLEANSVFSNRSAIAAGLRLGSVQHLGWSTAHLQAESLKFSNGLERWRLSYRQDVFLSRNLALSLSLQREDNEHRRADTGRMSLHYYFG